MAMGQGARGRTTNTNPDQFRTPDIPALSSKLRRAPARLAEIPVPTPASAPPIASTSRSGKRNSTRNVRDQPTLTQIDFVTVSQQPGSDDDDEGFDYIGNSGDDTREVIEIGDDDEEDDVCNADDSKFRSPSISRSKRAFGVRFDQGPSKRKKAANKSEGNSKRGHKKIGDKPGKGIQKDDKTLTQMNYVRRYVIEPDEEVKLEYAYITPKKKDTERQALKSNEVEDVRQEQTLTPEPSSQHKRRKLSPVLGAKESLKARNNEEKKAISSPVTPRKPLRSEIPSSQSPESPGVAFISTSQFRSATLSPSKRAFQVLNEPCIKEESPGLPKLKSTLKFRVRTTCLDENRPTHDSTPPPSSAQRRLAQNAPLAELKPPKHAGGIILEALKPGEHPGPTPRTVIYETDAETDYGDFQDDMPDVPSSPRSQEPTSPNEQVTHEGDPDSTSAESQELPPRPLSEQEVDSGPLFVESNLLSDASVCYQRLHPATQFPLDPVPTINTQKMAELFPEESTDLHTLTNASQSSSPMTNRPMPDIRMETQPQDLNQTEFLELDKTPTEVVPESSPVAQQDDESGWQRRVPVARDVVVQVESSQPVDRIRRQTTTRQDSGPRGILSRSQILSSSVMESIPIPVFWMSSQDSVGEPYSLPDK